jgi:hypothetical protein
MMTLGDNESLKIFLNLFQTKDILNYLLFQHLGKLVCFLEQKVVMIFYTIKKEVSYMRVKPGMATHNKTLLN